MYMNTESCAQAAIKVALADGQLSPDDLDAAGLRLVEGREDWWYAVDHKKVSDHLEG